MATTYEAQAARLWGYVISALKRIEANKAKIQKYRRVPMPDAAGTKAEAAQARTGAVKAVKPTRNDGYLASAIARIQLDTTKITGGVKPSSKGAEPPAFDPATNNRATIPIHGIAGYLGQIDALERKAGRSLPMPKLPVSPPDPKKPANLSGEYKRDAAGNISIKGIYPASPAPAVTAH